MDSDRAAFIKQHFGIEWPARHFFHLMINSTMGEEAAVQTIINGMAAVHERFRKEPGPIGLGWDRLELQDRFRVTMRPPFTGALIRA